MSKVTEQVLAVFRERGSGQYGSECVSQLEHAIQCAMLAQASGADTSLVVAALLHDIGHILDDTDLPDSDDEDLDDSHEERAYPWLLRTFGVAVADPVKLHVAAKRYLCTRDPSYATHLSPASYKSFLDQGGVMTEGELQAFEREPFYREALQLRKWDDLAKVASMPLPDISSFRSLMEECHSIMD
ncbi:phosphonate degradation HD-domain oxygenase [Pirellulaceae bacterium SH467]